MNKLNNDSTTMIVLCIDVFCVNQLLHLYLKDDVQWIVLSC